MSDTDTTEPGQDLLFEYELDAPPEKVWRALSIAAFREKWLPDADLADAEPVASRPGEEIAFRIREDTPPFRESLVTFSIGVNANGGTSLRIVHTLTDKRLHQRRMAANTNAPCLMRAA